MFFVVHDLYIYLGGSLFVRAVSQTEFSLLSKMKITVLYLFSDLIYYNRRVSLLKCMKEYFVYAQKFWNENSVSVRGKKYAMMYLNRNTSPKDQSFSTSIIFEHLLTLKDNIHPRGLYPHTHPIESHGLRNQFRTVNPRDKFRVPSTS